MLVILREEKEQFINLYLESNGDTAGFGAILQHLPRSRLKSPHARKGA